MNNLSLSKRSQERFFLPRGLRERGPPKGASILRQNHHALASIPRLQPQICTQPLISLLVHQDIQSQGGEVIGAGVGIR